MRAKMPVEIYLDFFFLQSKSLIFVPFARHLVSHTFLGLLEKSVRISLPGGIRATKLFRICLIVPSFRVLDRNVNKTNSFARERPELPARVIKCKYHEGAIRTC